MQTNLSIQINRKKIINSQKVPKKEKINYSPNELPVEMLDPELSHWVRVVKPSRASLTYERYE